MLPGPLFKIKTIIFKDYVINSSIKKNDSPFNATAFMKFHFFILFQNVLTCGIENREALLSPSFDGWHNLFS